MSKIGILTDSCSDLPQELADKYQIDILCFPILLEGKTYIERQTVTNEEFYDLMRQAEGVPTTAAITPIQYCEKYCEYLDKNYTDLLVVTLNSGGSSTYNNALSGIKMLEEERPGHHLNIQVVDSHTYSMVQGWPLVQAARKLRNGAELKMVVRELKEAYAQMEICLAAFSLKQMKKSGRVSAAAAFVGELLGLRPIISLNDGVSKVEAKVRGDASVVPAMIKYCQTRADMNLVEYGLGYTDGDKIKELKKQCKKAFGHEPAFVFQLGGVVSANTGPDALAITFPGVARR